MWRTILSISRRRGIKALSHTSPNANSFGPIPIDEHVENREDDFASPQEGLRDIRVNQVLHQSHDERGRVGRMQIMERTEIVFHMREGTVPPKGIEHQSEHESSQVDIGNP